MPTAKFTHLLHLTEVHRPNGMNAYTPVFMDFVAQPNRTAVLVIDCGEGNPSPRLQQHVKGFLAPLVKACRDAGAHIVHTPSMATPHKLLFKPGDTLFTDAEVSDVPDHAMKVADKLVQLGTDLIITVGYATDRCLTSRPAGIGHLYWYGVRRPVPLNCNWLLPRDCTMSIEMLADPEFFLRHKVYCDTFALYVPGKSATCEKGQQVIDAMKAAV